MARLAPFYLFYQCEKCERKFNRKELNSHLGGLICPNCQCPSFFYVDKCDRTAEHELTVNIQSGCFFFMNDDVGPINLPSITVEERVWYPDECPVCKINHYSAGGPDPIHFIHQVTLSDALRKFGFWPGQQLVGKDVVPGGMHVVIPFNTRMRIWINDIEINPARYYYETKGNWYYSFRN